MKNKKPKSNVTVPIVFSKNYDITLLGLQKLHPFDSEKYGKVYQYIVENTSLEKDSFYRPNKVSDDDLLLVHEPKYLLSLKKSSNIAVIAESLLLLFLPNFLLQRRLLNAMKYAVAGTVLGLELALKHGWSINLSGGYHHAKSNSGSGFCFYSDIALAVTKAREERQNLLVMIVDLDAHQGNGSASVFQKDKNTILFDIYNADVYPHDEAVKKYVKYDFPVKSSITDSEYNTLLTENLVEAINETKPDVIIYNAGVDPYEKDPLGNMQLSENCLIERDQFVFNISHENNIPILMLLSGGYTADSANIIGKSIVNLLQI